MFSDLDEPAIGYVANPTGNAAEVGQSIGETVRNEYVLVWSGIEGSERQKVASTIKIIGIDDGEWLADEVPCRTDGMARTPGLGTPLRNGKTSRQIIEALECVFNCYFPFILIPDTRTKFIEKVFPRHEHDLRETRPNGIENGIVEKYRIVRTNGRKLLDSTEPATHSSRHDEKRFHTSVRLRDIPPIVAGKNRLARRILDF